MLDDDWLDLRSTQYRTILNLQECLESSLVALGHYHYDHAMPPIPEQSSSQRLVLGFLTSGLQRYRLDGGDLILRGGQGIRFLPGSVYSSADLPEQRGEFFWLAIKAPAKRNLKLPGFSESAASAWWQQATSPELPRRFPISANLTKTLESLIALDLTDSSPMATTRLALKLGTLLVDLHQLMAEPMTHHTSPEILRSLKLLETQLPDPDLDTARLAKAANLAPSRFHIRFKEETGLPPADYLRHRRIIEAQRILATPSPPSITELAMQLGFSSSQYFATVFKRYTRQSPGDWMKSRQSSH